MRLNGREGRGLVESQTGAAVARLGIGLTLEDGHWWGDCPALQGQECVGKGGSRSCGSFRGLRVEPPLLGLQLLAQLQCSLPGC